MFDDELKAFEAESPKFPADADTLTDWGSDLLQLSQFGPNVSVSKLINKVAISTLGKAVEMGPTNHEALWLLGSAHTALAYLTSDGDAASIEFDKALECFQKADQLCPGQDVYLKSLRISAQNDRKWCTVMHGNRGPYKWRQRPNGTGSAASSCAKHEPESCNGVRKNNGPATSSSAKHEPKLHKAIQKNGGLNQVSQQINGGGSPASSSAKHELELHKAIYKHGGLSQISQQTLGEGSASSSSDIKGSARNKNSDLKYDIFGCGMVAVGLVAWIAMANSNVPPPPSR